MNADPHSHGLWAQSATPAPVTAPLDGTQRADIAVIGGGYTGLSAALHLAQGGASVAVLEAHAIGHGGSGRNVGLVNAGLWVMPDALEATLGPVFGPRLINALGAGPALVWELSRQHHMQCEAVPNGTLHCAADLTGLTALRERTRQWQQRDAPVRLLDARETLARTGTPCFLGALLDARAGTIQPLGYTRGLAHAAQAAGAMLHTDSPVTAARRSHGLWRLHTPDGTLEAPQVIVATNAWTGSLWPELRHEIVHLPYFNIATTPLTPAQRATILPGGEGCWDTRKVLTSFRLDAAGRLILGSVGMLRGIERHCHRGWARRMLRLLYPQLGNMPFDTEWHGMIGMTDDAMPRFHHLAPGVISISGYNGRGIAPGTVFGRLLAQRALGVIDDAAMPLPLTTPRAQSLRTLRETLIAAGAAALHLVSARRRP